MAIQRLLLELVSATGALNNSIVTWCRALGMIPSRLKIVLIGEAPAFVESLTKRYFWPSLPRCGDVTIVSS